MEKIIVQSRRSGLFHAFVLNMYNSMVSKDIKHHRFGVVKCDEQDRDRIISMIGELGIKVKAEPIHASVYFNLLNHEPNEIIGYIFIKDDQN